MEKTRILSTCASCGEPRLAREDGRNVVKRCRCDMEKATLARMRATIHPRFLGPGARTMSDWDPPAFSREKAGEAWPVMRAQRALAAGRLWEYCFAGEGRALLSSIAAGRNLFVRGPRGSGRGLIAASVKAVAAIKQASATPHTGEFDIFRAEMQDCMSFGKEGAEAKALVADKYLDVQLMVVENVRAESAIKFSGEIAKVKFKGADYIDHLVARRASSRGSMLLTSSDFVGEVGATLGERLLDELCSDKTAPLLLFSPEEAAELLACLGRVHRDAHATLRSMAGGKDKRLSAREDAENVIRVEEGFYLEDAFEDIPGGGKAIQGMAESAPEGLPPAVLKRHGEFLAEREANGPAYKRGLLAARARVVMASGVCNDAPRGQPPRQQMAPSEVAEAGRILALACSPGGLAAAEAEADERLAKMGGRD